ncbi:MAG: hypothetical protein Q7U78_10455 [Gallionella sp.]|nr:hypothetical protein [Gallionella sp.]
MQDNLHEICGTERAGDAPAEIELTDADILHSVGSDGRMSGLLRKDGIATNNPENL